LPPQPAVHSGYLYRIALTGALAGLLFGFDTAVINGALLSLRSHFALSELQVEFAASSLLYGCFFGATAGEPFFASVACSFCSPPSLPPYPPPLPSF
jgi:hypothetical protein